MQDIVKRVAASAESFVQADDDLLDSGKRKFLSFEIVQGGEKRSDLVGLVADAKDDGELTEE